MSPRTTLLESRFDAWCEAQRYVSGLVESQVQLGYVAPPDPVILKVTSDVSLAIQRLLRLNRAVT